MGAPKNNTLPDQQARDAIATRLDGNMLVEAAAGTGKTTMMVKRMVALLGDSSGDGCASARNLAAVTFTRKAAAELRANFQVALEKAVAEASGPLERRLSEALENIDQCFIGTIHSFCASLLRSHAVEAGLAPRFRVLDGAQAATLLFELTDDVLRDRLTERDETALASVTRLGLDRLRAAGVHVRNDVLEFHDRRLVFVLGPGDVTVELAEWQGDTA